MSVQIRPPRSGDAEDMARVWLSAGAYYAELNPAHFPLPSNNPVPNAAHQSVREVGWTGLFVDAPAVDRALWRKGIGSALLEAAEWWGRDRGAGVVRLNT